MVFHLVHGCPVHIVPKMRGGVERVVIVVGKNGAQIKEAVSRSGVAEKLTIEFLEDMMEPYRQFHAKSILRAR